MVPIDHTAPYVLPGQLVSEVDVLVASVVYTMDYLLTGTHDVTDGLVKEICQCEDPYFDDRNRRYDRLLRNLRFRFR